MSNDHLKGIAPAAWTVRGDDLRWRTWDDAKYVVYHIPSGQTNVIGRFGMEILWCLSDGPLDLEMLSETIRQQLGEADEEMLLAIPALVAHFEELGLIHECEPAETLELADASAV